MASIPINLDIDITTGDDKLFSANISTSSGAVDISAYEVFFTVKENFTDSDALAVVKLESSDITHTSSGDLSIPMYARDSSGDPLDVAPYYYDIQFITPSGDVQTWWKGIYNVGWHSTIRTS